MQVLNSSINHSSQNWRIEWDDTVIYYIDICYQNNINTGSSRTSTNHHIFFFHQVNTYKSNIGDEDGMILLYIILIYIIKITSTTDLPELLLIIIFFSSGKFLQIQC